MKIDENIQEQYERENKKRAYQYGGVPERDSVFSLEEKIMNDVGKLIKINVLATKIKDNKFNPDIVLICAEKILDLTKDGQLWN